MEIASKEFVDNNKGSGWEYCGTIAERFYRTSTTPYFSFKNYKLLTKENYLDIEILTPPIRFSGNPYTGKFDLYDYNKNIIFEEVMKYDTGWRLLKWTGKPMPNSMLWITDVVSMDLNIYAGNTIGNPAEEAIPILLGYAFGIMRFKRA